jgi:hypothetical protein
VKTSERPRLFCEPARPPGRGNLADALDALAGLAPGADGVQERYERLSRRLAGDPLLAASRIFALALAVEFLDLAERLALEASGESDGPGRRPGRLSETRRLC